MAGQAIRLIHVGLGGWGGDWARSVIPTLPDIDCVAKVDPIDQPYARLADALDAVESDVVLVTVPLDFHVPVTLEALRAGKHVLVEKPFGHTVAEAREAVELAEELGLKLAVSQNYRFYPAARTAAGLVREQKLGQLGVVNLDFRKWANKAPAGDKHRHYNIKHPLLYDMAIHHFDLMRMVLDQEPVEVYAKVTDPPYSRFNNPGAAALTITFSGGTIVSYRGSWVSSGAPTPWSGRWYMECERGEIYWTGRDGGAGVTENDQVEIRELEGQPKQVSLPEMQHVGRQGTLMELVRAIRTGDEPETSGRRNLGSLALAEAAARSTETGKPEPVNVPG